MKAEELRHWIFTRRAAEQREREDLRRNPPSSETSVQRALELFAIAAQAVGWPPPYDVVSAREDDIGYARWDRLRMKWRT